MDVDAVNSCYSQFGPPTEKCLPILYSEKYNISFLGIEKLHPFDSCKYRNIMNKLLQRNLLQLTEVIEPTKLPDRKILKMVHTDEYLESLKQSKTVAHITEILFVAWFPYVIVRSRVLEPMLYATSGSILAGKYAMDRGWAINLGGGYHHCSSSQGGGFCAYSDITLSYKILRQNYPQAQKVMIIDLDAHQGNGHARDKLTFKDNDVYILDMYNKWIYPGDIYAKEAINTSVELSSGCDDTTYLTKLSTALQEAFSKFTPSIIYYNAGTDILQGDPLGLLNITPTGVLQRDEIVFRTAFERKIPIVMLLSGGYQRSTAEVIASSIINLDKQLGLRKTITIDITS